MGEGGGCTAPGSAAGRSGLHLGRGSGELQELRACRRPPAGNGQGATWRQLRLGCGLVGGQEPFTRPSHAPSLGRGCPSPFYTHPRVGRTSSAWENSPSETPPPSQPPARGDGELAPRPRCRVWLERPPLPFSGVRPRLEKGRDPWTLHFPREGATAQVPAEGREEARPSSSLPEGRSLQGWGRSSAERNAHGAGPGGRGLVRRRRGGADMGGATGAWGGALAGSGRRRAGGGGARARSGRGLGGAGAGLRGAPTSSGAGCRAEVRQLLSAPGAAAAAASASASASA